MVNERIINFEYGVVDRKNRPSPLKQQVLNTNSATISQTGNVDYVLLTAANSYLLMNS